MIKTLYIISYMKKCIIILVLAVVLACPGIARAAQDCGQDIRCFEKAAELCQPATLTTSNTQAQGGSGILVTSVVNHTIVGPTENTLCTYQFIIKKLDLKFDEQLTRTQQAHKGPEWVKNWQTAITKEVQYENMGAECKIPLGTQLLISSAYWETKNLGLDAENAFSLEKKCAGSVIDYYKTTHQQRLAQSRDYDRENALTYLQEMLSKYYEINHSYPVAQNIVLGEENAVSLDMQGFGKAIKTNCFDCFDERNLGFNPADKFTYTGSRDTYLVSGNLETDADWLHAMTQKDMKKGPIYLTPEGIDQVLPDQPKSDSPGKYNVVANWLWRQFVFPFTNAWHFIQDIVKKLA